MRIRLVNLRTSIILSQEGGTLKKMLPAFKLALGGRIGSGKQFMIWIDINDFCSAILFIINHQTINGAVNMVVPNSVTNTKYIKFMIKYYAGKMSQFKA